MAGRGHRLDQQPNKPRTRRRLWLTASGVALMLAALVGFWQLPVNTPLPAFAKAGSQLERQLQQRASLPEGYHLSLFAAGLPSARLMIETGNGDFIVSSRRDRVYLVKGDRKDDGRADGVSVLLSGLNEPHGVLLDAGWLYVAEEHRITRRRFDAASGRITSKAYVVLSGMPDDGGHSTRTLKKGPDGWFYVAIGSSCNVCIERHPWRAAIIRFRPEQPGQKPEIFATGLRNTVGIDWQPGSDKLYGVDNGRDWLGDFYPPDELNLIERGKFYGWPYRNGDNKPDPDYGKRFKTEAITPVFGFDAHIAPLSIRFLRHQKDPSWNGVALVGQHGSWNRTKKHGYRIVSMHFGADGKVTRKVFLDGFLKNGKVIGRPVDVLERRDGSLLISDDYAGAIWQVRRK